MDVDALRWFQQVADGITVTEVSDLESVTQSGVSRALARLERDVGTPLLTRSGRTLRMTRAGATFKGYLDRALHELDDGFAELAELASPDTGDVSLAFQPSLGVWLIPSLIEGFRASHPMVRFDLHALHVELSPADFVAGGTDVAITSVRHNDAGIAWRPLQLEPLVLIVATAHPLASAASVAVAALVDEPLVMLRGRHGIRQTTDELCERAGFRPHIVLQCDEVATLTELVAAGLGVAIVPVHSATRTAGVVAIPVIDAGASRLLGLAWSTDRRLLPAARLFRDHVLTAAAEH